MHAHLLFRERTAAQRKQGRRRENVRKRTARCVGFQRGVSRRGTGEENQLILVGQGTDALDRTIPERVDGQRVTTGGETKVGAGAAHGPTAVAGGGSAGAVVGGSRRAAIIKLLASREGIGPESRGAVDVEVEVGGHDRGRSNYAK